MKRIRLSFIASPSPSPHAVGGWRQSRSYRGLQWHDPAYWEHVARVLERGKLDMLFFADSLQLHDDFKGSTDITLRYGIQFPRLDPMPFIPLMARATRYIGFGVTSSTAYHDPYYFARLMSTLDHVTGGRLGWNIVAGYGSSEARKVGLQKVRSHDDRYRRADEYTAVCLRLWDSVRPDAILADRESGAYADPEKIEKFSHEGEYFRTQGPLAAAPSPQGHPVLIQAGASEEGLNFAAKFAEAHFAARGSVEGMRQHMGNLSTALAKTGRKESDVKVFWSAAVFVGETEEDARRKERNAMAAVPLEAGIALLSGHLGVDLSQLPLDEPIRNLDPEKIEGARGLLKMFANDFDEDFSVADAARFDGAGLSGLRVVGTARQIADRLEELIEGGGGDGFMMRPHSHPGSYEDFVDLVVPELQARGRARREYPGKTMRESLASEE
jgi:FMN-dependent oxidoreductase (nitrilotriacetate monooxygenase family)